MNNLVLPALPHSLALAASYVAVLIVLGIVLTYRVVLMRNSARVSLGDGEDPELRKRIRAHGNFSEHAPLIMAALVLLPLLGASEWMIHAVGLPGLVGRIVHSIAVSIGNRQLRFRVLGMLLTTAAQAFGAALLLFQAWR